MLPSVILFFFYSAQSFGRTAYNYSFTQHQRGNIYKIVTTGDMPGHIVSLTAVNSTTELEEKSVNFHFSLMPGWNPPSIMFSQVIGNNPPSKWRNLTIPGYPRFQDSLRELIYYFIFYEGASYFSIPTVGNPEIYTVILSTDDWWPSDGFKWMTIDCHSCLAIYFSVSCYGNTDGDLKKLSKESKHMSPYYNKTNATIDPVTLELLTKRERKKDNDWKFEENKKPNSKKIKDSKESEEFEWKKPKQNTKSNKKWRDDSWQSKENRNWHWNKDSKSETIWYKNLKKNTNPNHKKNSKERG